MYVWDKRRIGWCRTKEGVRMRREVLAGLALTVLLFGSAYLAAGDGAVQEETKTEQTAGDAGVTLRVLEAGTVKDMTLE